MIVWSGHGYLVALMTFLSSLFMEFGVEAIVKDEGYYQRAGWPLAAALCLAGVFSFVAGSALNGDKGEPDAGPRNRHTLFWIPMQWWGPILALIGGVVLVSRGFGA